MNTTLSDSGKKHRLAFIIVTMLFFMWGFITCMNDILIPFLKKVFELNYTQAMMVQLAFFGAYAVGSGIYFLMSVIIGDPIVKIGYKNGIIIGLLISALACFMFFPAAHVGSFAFFLSALFILGLGFTMLQIAANPYVAVLGKPETASGRLNLSQGFNSLGTTIAPIIGGYLVFHFFAQFGSPLLDSIGNPVLTEGGTTVTASSVQIPYLIFGGVFVLLAIFFALVKLPRINESVKITSNIGALKHRHLLLGIIAIFMYVGAEVAIGSSLINYMNELLSFSEMEAKSFLAFYWGGAMIGRFIGAISLSGISSKVKMYLGMIAAAILAFTVIYGSVYIEGGMEFSRIKWFLLFMALNFVAFMIGKSKANRTLWIFSFIVIALLITTVFTDGLVAMWAVIGIGLFNSIMWSNIFTLAIDNLKEYTSQGSSLLVMAILGGAIIPLIQGAFADHFSLQNSFLILIIPYLYLAYYGISGYKQKTLSV